MKPDLNFQGTRSEVEKKHGCFACKTYASFIQFLQKNGSANFNLPKPLSVLHVPRSLRGCMPRLAMIKTWFVSQKKASFFLRKGEKRIGRNKKLCFFTLKIVRVWGYVSGSRLEKNDRFWPPASFHPAPRES